MPEILAFVDTNVLPYAASTDPTEATRKCGMRSGLAWPTP